MEPKSTDHDGFGSAKGSFSSHDKSSSSADADADADASGSASASAESVLQRTIEHFTEDWLSLEDNTDMLDLFSWETEHWHLFDPDEEEHTIQHKQLHEQYARDFEEKLERFVQSQGMGLSQFHELVRDSLLRADARDAKDSPGAKDGGGSNATDGGRGAQRSLGEKLLHVVHKATDYEAWAEGMRQAVRDQRAMEEVD